MYLQCIAIIITRSYTEYEVGKNKNKFEGFNKTESKTPSIL